MCRCTILRSPKTLLCRIRKTQWMDNVLHERLAQAWAKYDLNRLLGRAHQFLPSTHDGYPKGTRHDHLDAHVCNSGLRAVQSSRQPAEAATAAEALGRRPRRRRRRPGRGRKRKVETPASSLPRFPAKAPFRRISVYSRHSEQEKAGLGDIHRY